MVGFYAFADSSKPIRTDLDNELVGKEDLITWDTCEVITDCYYYKMLAGSLGKKYKLC